MFKLGTTIAITLILLIFSIYEIFLDAPFLALTFFFTAILTPWTIFAGLESIFKSEFTKMMVILITFSSIAHAFDSNNLTKSGYIKDNVELFSKSLRIKNCPYDAQHDDKKRLAFNKLKKVLVTTCGMQNYADLTLLTSDLVKARYLDPATGALDSIYNELTKKDIVTCKDVARQLEVLCPGQLNL
ncbi:hypothetical protein [Photobacterium kagoshimensis]|uniref:hypothetical protein n=1 Tax=Photobacterium kagoshimensis TaxID=2910242 RepID=UPI003D0A74CF